MPTPKYYAKRAVRYGLLIRKADGTYLVWGPKKREDFSLDYHELATLRQDSFRNMDFENSSLESIKKLQEHLKLGEIVDVIEVINFNEIYSRNESK